MQLGFTVLQPKEVVKILTNKKKHSDTQEKKKKKKKQNLKKKIQPKIGNMEAPEKKENFAYQLSQMFTLA